MLQGGQNAVSEFEDRCNCTTVRIRSGPLARTELPRQLELGNFAQYPEIGGRGGIVACRPSRQQPVDQRERFERTTAGNLPGEQRKQLDVDMNRFGSGFGYETLGCRRKRCCL